MDFDWEVLEKIFLANVKYVSFSHNPEKIFFYLKEELRVELLKSNHHMQITLYRDDSTLTYSYKLKKQLFRCKNYKKKAISYFVESLMYNHAVVKKLSSRLKKFVTFNNEAEQIEKLIRTEVWKFKPYSPKDESARFLITDVKVYQFITETTSFFYIKDKQMRGIRTYNSNSENDVLESFIFGLRYSEAGKNMTKYITENICTRDENWIRKHGM